MVLTVQYFLDFELSKFKITLKMQSFRGDFNPSYQFIKFVLLKFS